MAASRTEDTPLLAESNKAVSRKHEIKVMLEYAFPLVLMNMLRHFILGAAFYSMGHLSTSHLAAINLIALHSGVFGFSIILGLNAALDTLAASKSASPKLASIYTMRQLIVSATIMPLIILSFCFSRSMFAILTPKSDPEVLDLAAGFLRVLAWAMPAYSASDCLRRFLLCHGLVKGPTIAIGIGAPISMFLNWLLVYGPERVRIGYLGAALAAVIAYNLILVILVVYALLVLPKGVWAGFSRVVFQELSLNYKFGFAGVLSLCSEWWAIEALGIGASYLGTLSQATNSVYSATLSLTFPIPYAISIAASIRVGQLLGRNLPTRAAAAASASQLLILVIVGCNAALLFGFKRSFARLYTEDSAVADLSAKYIWLFVLVTVCDGLQNVNSGILRGSGLPMLAARFNVVCYYAIGMPIGILLTVKYPNLGSLWAGFAVATLLAQLAVRWRIHRMDWHVQAAKALERIAESNAKATASRHIAGEEEDLI